eukprot:2771576-Amphidinium_carterae.1
MAAMAHCGDPRAFGPLPPVPNGVVHYQQGRPVVHAASPVGVPPSYTSGLPDPENIERQRTSFLQALDEQERDGATILDQQRKQQLDYIQAQADQQKKQLYMQIDQQVRTQEMALMQ